MKYPLNLQSKIIAIAPQIYVTDSDRHRSSLR